LSKFSVETVFSAIDKMSAPISKMQARVGKFSRAVDKGVRSASKTHGRMDEALGKVGRTAAIAGATGGAAFAKMVSTGMDFEQVMTSAGAKMGDIQLDNGVVTTSKDFEKLIEKTKELGATTEHSASQVGGAVDKMAMAGMSATESLTALPGVVDLATAAGTDLISATDIATDALGAFGLEVSDLTMLNDQMAKTTTSANVSMFDLFETIKEGGPVAKAAGASTQEFMALTGKLGDAGIKGSKAGTTLKNMYLSLQAPTKQAADVMKNLGVETRDSAGNFLPMAKIMDNFKEGLKKSKNEAGDLKTVFGKIPIAGVNVLLGVGGQKLAEYTDKLKNSKDAAKNMAEVMRSTAQGSFKGLQSAIEGVLIATFGLSNSEGGIKGVIDQMTAWITANREFIAGKIGSAIKWITENIGTLISVAKNLVIAIAIFKAIGLVLKTVTIAMTILSYKAAILGVAMKAGTAAIALFKAGLVILAGPVGLVIAAISALIAAGIALYTYWEPISAFFADLWAILADSPVGKLASDITEGLGAALDFAVEKFMGFVNFLKDTLTPIFDAVMEGLMVPIQGWIMLLKTLWEVVKPKLQPLLDFFTSVYDKLIGIKDAVTGSKFFRRMSDLFSKGAGVFDREDAERAKFDSFINRPQVVTGGDRVSKSIEESKQTSSAEILLTAGSGTNASVVSGSLGAGISLNTSKSGAF